MITGAGASHDVIDLNNTGLSISHEYRPPLTKNLFNPFKPRQDSSGLNRGDSFYIRKLLAQYSAVANIALDKTGDERDLEEYLYALKKHKKLSIRNQFWTIPYYLNDLFLMVSHKYIPLDQERKDVSNYSRLLRKIVSNDIEELIWINLNYDLFADFAIQAIVLNNQLSNFKNFMELNTVDGMKIKYSKPHGSVGWWRLIEDNNIPKHQILLNYASLPDDFETKLSQKVYYENEARKVQPNVDYWFPAITAPLGEYEFIHSGHRDEILSSIKDFSNVLIIGFSALDKDILDLMKEISNIQRLMIVNGSSKAFGEVTLQRLTKHAINIQHPGSNSFFNGEFSTFLYSAINGFLKTLV